MSVGPGFHRCLGGVKMGGEIATFGGVQAALRLEGTFNGEPVSIAVEVIGCPFCLEPLTALGRELDRMKRVEGLK